LLPRWFGVFSALQPLRRRTLKCQRTFQSIHGIVDGDDIEQGDILEGCPVFLPPNDLVIGAIGAETTAKFAWQRQDLIVMSQSCDLSKGREKVDDVLLCAVWKRSELRGAGNHLGEDEGMEEARKGRLPGFHVLAASVLSGFEREIRVVDFRRVHSLPVPFVRNTAKAAERLRLLPPYREHLSQSFARFFMRVGLPVDIPPFTGKKK
jgi:hypothetical protein